MTKETFVKIVASIIKEKGVSVPESKVTKLNSLGRQYESHTVDISGAMESIRSIFSDNYELDRHAYSEIEKSLKRH